MIEVGLGGRLDATNVLHPELTICTDISYDHTEILGRSVKKIAGEKAGIIKPGVPHLIGMLPREAEQVMRQRCRKVDTRMYKLTPSEFTGYPKRFALDFRAPGFSFARLKPSLIGTHQLVNCAIALKALAILKANGLALTKTAVVEGITHTEWPGRFQIIERSGQPTIVLDVCHNEGGARAFIETYKHRFPTHRPPIIVGIVKHKDYQGMFDHFWEIARRYMLVRMKTRRSSSTAELAQTVDFKGIPIWRCSSLESAYRQVLEAVDSDDIIAMVGSHYLVGEFLKTYRQR